MFSDAENRLIENISKIVPSILVNELLLWFDTDEKCNRMSTYIESGVVQNQQQLVRKILHEFMKPR